MSYTGFLSFIIYILSLVVIIFVYSFPKIKKRFDEIADERDELKEELEQKEKFKQKELMTETERNFLRILVTSRAITSEFNIHPQVAMSAFLTTKLQEDRNKFDRKRVDFLICDKTSRKIYCVVEIDDKSHENKQLKDLERDKMLEYAGVKTLRYKYENLPTPEKLKQDIYNLHKQEA